MCPAHQIENNNFFPYPVSITSTNIQVECRLGKMAGDVDIITMAASIEKQVKS